MAGKFLRIFTERNHFFFIAEMNPIFTLNMKCTGFSAFIDVIVITVNLDISCKKQMKFSIVHQRRTGINTMAVIRRIRIKSSSFILPVNHVFTGVMSPELQTTFYIKRCILKEYMIFSFIPAQSIGIIQPADWRHQMMSQSESSFCHVCIFFNCCYISFKNLC